MMSYYKVRIEVWCDWDPAESDLEEIAENISAGEAICTKRKILKVVDRPQDIEDELLWRGRRRRRSKSGLGEVPG